MNFKTTIVLIVLLAVAGLALFFTRDRRGGDADSTETATAGEGKRLVAAESEDVTKLSVTRTGEDPLTLEKVDGTWRMTRPVSAAVDTFAVDSLVRAITDLRSRGTVELTDENAGSTGVREPSYLVEVTGTDGKATKIAVGARQAVGDNLYVAVDGNTEEAHVVPASVWEQLEKPASEYRRDELVDVSSTAVNQVEVTRPEGRLVLHKVNNDWQVIEPTKMPAERTEVDDLIFAVTGLRAGEFVSENAAEASQYQLDKPTVTVTLDTAAPATQPATAPAATTQSTATTVKFGRYTDVLRQNVYATASNAPSIVTVPASSLDAFKVKPIELRDRRVLDVDPEQVSRIAIRADLAATTQPTTRPASQRDVAIERRKAAPATQVAAATQPATTQATTGPATTPSTTQASTQPSTAPAPTKWQLASTTQPSTDAGDAKVDSLLTSLHPLRATRYLEAAPTTQPTSTYTITLTTVAPGGASAEHVIKISDRGWSEPPVGEYNGLVFEVDRSLLTRLEGDFAPGGTADPDAPMPTELPPGFPGLPQ